MIRLEHRSLPAGLSAVARRGARGVLTIVVSESLDAGHQRAAVRAALRAARRHDWRLGLLPLPALVFMSAKRSALSKLGHVRPALRNFGHFLRAHAVETAVAATVTAGAVVSGVIIFAMPVAHVPYAAPQPGQPGYQQTPGTNHSAAPGRAHGHTRPGAVPSNVGGTGPGVIAVVTPREGSQPTPAPEPSPFASTSSPSGGQPPGPSPSTSTSTAKPTPTPSSSPSGGSGGGGCLRILGIVVCL